MKKLLFILSFIYISTYAQESQNQAIINDLKSCLNFVEKKKEKKEGSRKYEYIKGFTEDGWQCIEKGINSYVFDFKFETDWSSEIYLSKKFQQNDKLILLASELRNESKKRKRNYEYLGIIAEKLENISLNIKSGKEKWEAIHGFRSEAPKAGEAPDVQIGDYQEFKLKNGLNVILVENHKKPVVSFYLVPDYSPFLEKEKAGTKDMLTMMMGTGTKTKSKAEIDEISDYIGATVNFNGLDGFFASSLKKHQTVLLELMNDIIKNSVFSEQEFNKAKKQLLSGLESQKSNANAISNNISNLLNYGKNHPYGELVTEETVNNIELKDIKNLYSQYFRPNISYLVIVGDIDLNEAKEVSNKYFKKWKKKTVPNTEFIDCNSPGTNQVAFVHKEGAVQSTINITYPINLKPGSKDDITCKVMNSILGGGVFSGRLMQNLREDKAFTYGARSSLSSDKFMGEFSAYADVRNEVTDSSVVEFIYELDKMKKQPVTEKELNVIKNYMTGSFSRSLESPFRIAQLALNIKINNLNKDYYKNYLKTLNSVSIEDISIAAQKYMKPNNCNIVIVGNKEIAGELTKFDGDKKITYYNYKGDVVIMESKKIPEGTTVESIIQRNIQALGGIQNMTKWMDVIIHSKGELEVGGRKISVNSEKGYLEESGMDDANNMYYQKVHAEMMGKKMELLNVKFYSDYETKSGTWSGTSMNKELNNEQIEKIVQEDDFLLYPILITLIPEVRQFISPVSFDKYKFELKEIEKVNENDAYKLIRTNTTLGKTKSMYFDINSGHLVKEIFEKDGKINIIEYSEYTNYENIILPKITSIMTEQGATKMEIQKVIIDGGIQD